MNRGRYLGFWVIVALLLVAGAWAWIHTHAPDTHGVPIGGGDAGGLPRADASTEGFDATPLQAAVDWAGKERAGALLISRHGHLLIERYSGDVNVDSLVAGGAHVGCARAAGRGHRRAAARVGDAGHRAFRLRAIVGGGCEGEQPQLPAIPVAQCLAAVERRAGALVGTRSERALR